MLWKCRLKLEIEENPDSSDISITVISVVHKSLEALETLNCMIYSNGLTPIIEENSRRKCVELILHTSAKVSMEKALL